MGLFDLKKKKSSDKGNNEFVSSFKNDEFNKLYSLKYSQFIDYIVKKGINLDLYKHNISDFVMKNFPDPFVDILGIFRWTEMAAKDSNVYDIDRQTEWVREGTRSIFNNQLCKLKSSNYINNSVNANPNIDESIFLLITMEVYFNIIMKRIK